VQKLSQGLVACRGLEQETALPRDSFLQPYYADVYEYLRVGPPLLLVVNGLNMSRSSGDVNAVCSISGCNDTSLLNLVRLPTQNMVFLP
jgi:Niemann-Pick C1 protein